MNPVQRQRLLKIANELAVLIGDLMPSRDHVREAGTLSSIRQEIIALERGYRFHPNEVKGGRQ